MTDRDSAFLWETEALRSSPQRVTETEIQLDLRAEEPQGEVAEQWVTLRDASRATGIPVETMRKWARRSTIPSYLTPTAAGTNIRMVDLEGVRQRAAELGRVLEPGPPAMPPTPAADESQAPESLAEPAPGTMIVPVDAWNKMLNQLGNLHEAGQQLAVARERAAKAETEAMFLRERLTELRNGAPPATRDEPQATSEKPSTAPESAIVPDPPEKIWQYLVRRVRDRRPG